MLKKILGALSERTLPTYTLVIEHPVDTEHQPADELAYSLKDEVQMQVVNTYGVVRHLGKRPRRLVGTVEGSRGEDGSRTLSAGARCLVRLADDNEAMDFAEAVRSHACEHMRVLVLPGDRAMDRGI